MLHFYILLSTKSIVLLLYIFSTIFVSCSLNQHKRFKLYPKRGQILYDETDGAPSPNDYEFLVSEDGEDDIPDKLYEEILPDLPPHDLIFMGKNLGKVEPNFVTPKPLVTKFPHTKPPIEIPSYFVNDEDKFL
uniref:Uncharacterized protein n=1 Tax=Parastrongyloides trichosuri TaxID=131310 RepID=A0A0N4Z617_PARTI